MRQENGKHKDEVVRLGDCDAEFLQECLEVLFDALLTMEANRVMQGRLFSMQACRGAVIGFGLSYPFAGRPFHTGLSPST